MNKYMICHLTLSKKANQAFFFFSYFLNIPDVARNVTDRNMTYPRAATYSTHIYTVYVG